MHCSFMARQAANISLATAAQPLPLVLSSWAGELLLGVRRGTASWIKDREIMRPGGLSKVSLSNRIVVVSRKPHARCTDRSRTLRRCKLPTNGCPQTARDVTDFLTSFQWPQLYLYQCVGSLAASHNLNQVSSTQIARLCEMVRVVSSTTKKKPGSMEEDQERQGTITTTESEKRNDILRVESLTALIPTLSTHSSLHTMTQSVLSEVIESRGGLAPETENSLLEVCGEDHNQLVHFTQLARKHGHRFSRSFYRGALSKVLKASTTFDTEKRGERDGRGGGGGGGGGGGKGRQKDEMPTVAGELMSMMSGDWEKAVVETEVFWLALHLASKGNQVKAVLEEMNSSQFVADESVTLELVRACLRTADTLRQGQPGRQHPDPSEAVRALVSRLPPRQATVSASVFERVLKACAESIQSRMAYDTFCCMTEVHGLAPTRKSLQGLARLLTAPPLTANRRWRRFRLSFTSHILNVSVSSYGGRPPGWVFSEIARPFTELLGLHGYQFMYGMCHDAVIREHGEPNSEVIMEELWGRGLYHALLQSCRVNHGPHLATYLLSHMTHRGISPNGRTFRHLLKFIISPAEIEDYIAVLMKHMQHLSKEEMAGLEQPIQTLIQSSLQPEDRDTAVGLSVSQILESLSTSDSSDQDCISQLASLSGVKLSSHNTQHVIQDSVSSYSLYYNRIAA